MVEREFESARRRYSAVLEQRCSDLAAYGSAVLDRVSPPNWTLEWSLPIWLGQALLLPPPVTERLLLCNLFGLCYVRLEDDRADGELSGQEQVHAMRLAEFCLKEAIGEYRILFEPSSPFWARLDAYLAEWRASQGEPRLTGARGAPLKIGGAAACLLAGQPELIPPLDALLDRVLHALVMFDHAQDWEQDLEAGRWNGFVAFFVEGAQSAETRAENRTAVQEALSRENGGLEFFERIAEELRAARVQGEELGLGALAAYLTDLAEQVRSLYAAWSGEYRARVKRMTALLFSSTYTDGAGAQAAAPVSSGAVASKEEE